jgi:HEAT repeat protein
VALNEHAAAARADLAAALDDPAPSVRIEAARALVQLGPSPAAIRALEEALQDENADVVLHAARTGELLGDRARELKPAMQEALTSADGQGVLGMFIAFSARAFLAGVEP